MAQYRAFTIGDDGHSISYRAFTCVNDAEAIVWAKQRTPSNWARNF
jgi:hypothetical protein